jgi:hypothetical protein
MTPIIALPTEATLRAWIDRIQAERIAPLQEDLVILKAQRDLIDQRIQQIEDALDAPTSDVLAMQEQIFAIQDGETV